MASSTRRYRTSGDYRKSRELEEARKAGREAPQVDDEGNDINPHIPDYVKRVPWYLGIDKPTLKHQKSSSFDSVRKQMDLNTWYKRGEELVVPTKVTKYVKEACENCGSLQHEVKSCIERPRKVGAKYNFKQFFQDNRTQTDLDLDYESKRDRYNGYDPERYREVVEMYEKIDSARRSQILKEEEKVAESAKENGGDNLMNYRSDDFKSTEDKDNFGQFARIDGKIHTSVRHLRIREDTAKYLLNLEEDAPFYDPKSRSMRQNPNPNSDPEEPGFKGDNALRYTGDTKSFLEINRFAWNHDEINGSVVHVQAAPSETEILFEKYKKEKEKTFLKSQQKVLEEYGGHEHLITPDPELLFDNQSEVYTEFSIDGKLKIPSNIQSRKVIVKSKYEEDVHVKNHHSVYGSWWNDGKWGYSCCHQYQKNSYCTANTTSSGSTTITTT